jgi:hypothetical protein
MRMAPCLMRLADDRCKRQEFFELLYTFSFCLLNPEVRRAAVTEAVHPRRRTVDGRLPRDKICQLRGWAGPGGGAA